jgi:hypothetical protein
MYQILGKPLDMLKLFLNFMEEEFVAFLHVFNKCKKHVISYEEKNSKI